MDDEEMAMQRTQPTAPNTMSPASPNTSASMTFAPAAPAAPRPHVRALCPGNPHREHAMSVLLNRAAYTRARNRAFSERRLLPAHGALRLRRRRGVRTVQGEC